MKCKICNREISQSGTGQWLHLTHVGGKPIKAKKVPYHVAEPEASQGELEKKEGKI
jgi:hypothetical protein